MKINRNNYEVWFLDYFEGQLSPEQIKELMGFLDIHYDLKEEFDSFENVSLPPAKKVVFDSKSLLKKPVITAVDNINEKNYPDFFIAYYEGDLTDEEKSNVLLFIEKNAPLNKEFELFSKVKAEPDSSIIYPAKESLRKNAVIPVGSINDGNYAEHFIAAMEGELTLQQRSELSEFLNKNPHLHKDYQLFGHTKLAVDTAIVFNRKEQLKKTVLAKRRSKVSVLYYAVSAAASVIVLLAIYFLMNRESVSRVNMAYRSNIELKYDQVGNTYGQSFNNTVPIYYSGTTVQNNNQNVDLPVEKIDAMGASCLYTSSANTGVIQGGNPEMLPKITAYEDYYAMIMEKKNETAPQDKEKDNGFLSLKDFALFNAKKAIAPEDKKEDITPSTKITGWDLAQTSVEKASQLTGANAKLTRNENDKGFKLTLGNNFELASNTGR